MKLLKPIAIMLFPALLLGCAEPNHYPITGQECGPEDPVQDITIPDCGPALS